MDRFYVNSFKSTTALRLCLLLLSWSVQWCLAQDYDSVSRLLTDKLSSPYNTAIRPLIDQSQSMNVSLTFDIIALVEVDDIKQQFVVNGFLTISWKDEKLAWDPTAYNNTYAIGLYPNQIWRPRLILGNTIEERDLFEDDYSPTLALFDGTVTWYPGSLFPTSCKLNLEKYPFDEQVCSINMFPMHLIHNHIMLRASTQNVSKMFYSESGEWEIFDTDFVEGTAPNNIPFISIRFFMRRRPGFFIINIVMPIVLLSFLNIMVFLIPVESGEKISYSITVLLALAVFVSIISGMLPRSSDVTPLVTVYLMVLLLISVGTVIVAVVIVYLHHQDEKCTKRQKAKSTFNGLFNKVKLLNTATKPMNHVTPVEEKPDGEKNSEPEQPTSKAHTMINMMTNFKNFKKTVPMQIEPEPSKEKCRDPVNRYRMIGKHIDFYSFIIFLTVWVTVTLGFLIAIAT